LDLKTMEAPKSIDFGAELDEASKEEKTSQPKPWKDIWSAGHGVGSIEDVPCAAKLVNQLQAQYQGAHEHQQQKMALLTKA